MGGFCSGFQALQWITLIVASAIHYWYWWTPVWTRSFTLELKDFHKAAKNMNGCITLKEQVQKDNFLRREHATQQSLTSLHLNDLQTVSCVFSHPPSFISHGGHTLRLGSDGKRCDAEETGSPQPASLAGKLGAEVTSRWERWPETGGPFSALSWGGWLTIPDWWECPERGPLPGLTLGALAENGCSALMWGLPGVGGQRRAGVPFPGPTGGLEYGRMTASFLIAGFQEMWSTPGAPTMLRQCSIYWGYPCGRRQIPGWADAAGVLLMLWGELSLGTLGPSWVPS